MSIKLTFKKNKKILYNFIRTVLIIFLIGYVCLVCVVSMSARDKTMKKFTEQEIEILEEEFGFILKDTEYISLAKCNTSHGDFYLQLWVKQIDNYEYFVQHNLNIDRNDFKPQKIVRDSNRRRFFNHRDEQENETIDGFEYVMEDETGFTEKGIEIYQEEGDDFYTAFFYKNANLKNEESLNMFY